MKDGAVTEYNLYFTVLIQQDSHSWQLTIGRGRGGTVAASASVLSTTDLRGTVPDTETEEDWHGDKSNWDDSWSISELIIAGDRVERRDSWTEGRLTLEVATSLALSASCSC